jgi:O-antigen ligase
LRKFLLTGAPVWRRRILLAIVIGVPILFLRTINDPINVPKLWWLWTLLSVVVVLRVAEGLQGLGWEGLKRLLVPAAAIAAPLLLAWLLSPYKAWALFGNYPRFTGLLPYLLVALFGILVGDAFAGRQLELAWAVVGAGAVVGLYGLVQIAGFDIFDWSVKGGELGSVAVSTLGNPNFTGAFLGIAFPLALGVVAVDPGRRRWAIGAAMLIGIGCLATRSEGGLAAAVAGAVVVGGSFFSARVRWVPLAGAVAASLIALGLVAAVASTIFISRDGPFPATVARRGDWWQGAASMAADAPLLGHGPAAFAIDGFAYRTTQDGIETGFDYTDEPHSVPLSFLVSAGAIGLGGWLFAMGWLMRRGWAFAQQSVLQAAFLGGVVAYLIQSLISIDTIALRVALWTVAGGLIAGTASAVAPARTSPKGKKRQREAAQPLKGGWIIGATAFIGLLSLWFGWRFLIADARVNQGDALFDSGKPIEASAAYAGAIDARADNHYRRLYADRLGDTALFLKADEDPRAQDLAGDFYEDTRSAYGYLDDFPHPNTIVEYARFLHAWAAFEPQVQDDALALYTRALKLDPNNPALVSEVEQARAEIATREAGA